MAQAWFLPDLVLIPRRHKADPSLPGVAETISCKEDLSLLDIPQCRFWLEVMLSDKMPRRYAANTFVIRILETFLFDQIALTDLM